MTADNKPHEYCKDCPGPLYFNREYEHLLGKINQMCTWKDKHELDQNLYREKREMEEKIYREETREKFSNLKTWAIGNLVALCFLLIGTIIVLLRQ